MFWAILISLIIAFAGATFLEWKFGWLDKVAKFLGWDKFKKQ